MPAKALHFRFFRQTYFFKIKLGFSLLCLFLFILCCVLGVWQLHRYALKKNLLLEQKLHLSAKPLALVNAQHIQFERIKVSGHYVNELTMLVQNRFYHDAPGFEVLTPLRMPHDKKLLLIDRGWVAKLNMPKIAVVQEQQNIVGYIKLLNEYQFILGDNILQPNKTPLVLQRIDIKEISQATQQSFYPFILRMDADQAHGFVRDWIITTVTPERHMAYAVQWFFLALVLLIAHFCFCCERQDG
jgi:surfeit locus 1 family protein